MVSNRRHDSMRCALAVLIDHLWYLGGEIIETKWLINDLLRRSGELPLFHESELQVLAGMSSNSEATVLLPNKQMRQIRRKSGVTQRKEPHIKWMKRCKCERCCGREKE